MAVVWLIRIFRSKISSIFWQTQRPSAFVRAVFLVVVGVLMGALMGYFGGRLGSLRVGATDLVVTSTPDDRSHLWGSFPMAPWAGRVRHGVFEFDGQRQQLPINLARESQVRVRIDSDVPAPPRKLCFVGYSARVIFQ